MPKHIKRKMKTFKGAETRAKLTLAFWDLKNMKSYIHWTSDSDKNITIVYYNHYDIYTLWGIIKKYNNI